MIKKIRKKAIAIMLLVLTMLSNLLPIFPMVQSLAVNNNNIGTSLDIVNLGEIPYHLKSHGVSSGGYVITHAVGYYDNGTFYPAFCMQRDRIGVDENHQYSVTITDLLSDQATYNRVWRVVTNGYPYKSVGEIGVRDWLYAYQATKMAVYCVSGQANVDDFYATDEIGQEIVNAIHRLVDIGNNGSATYRTPVANADKSGNMYLDGNYYVQNYTVSSNIEITSYDVAMTGFSDGTIITDKNGTQRNTFNVGETFQVRLPKNSVETGDINGKVRLTVTSKSYAVFYATSYDESLQDYTVTGDPLALTSSTTNLDLKGNTAGIKIKKIDTDTNEPIPNTTFQITKEDGTEIGTATTGEDGTVTFNNLYQANYVVKEIKNNDDYVLSQETINIPAYYNNITDKTITNKHKEGDLTIYKVDKDNHKITLGNVEFDLFSEEFNKVIGTYITDVNGEIHIKNLRTGNYKVIEKNTGKWYNLAEDTPIKIKWNDETKTTIENELKKGKVKVIKVDLDNKEVKLKDVEFQVLDKDGNVLETIKTNENGEATTKDYPVRDYETLTIKETKTGKWYKLNDKPQTVTLKENEITNITFTNEKKKGQIKVIKVDLDNKEVKIPDVEFKVYDEKGNVVDTLKTDKNGEATSKRLPIDQEYKVQETKTGKWYVLNENPQKVTLKEDEITNMTFTNEKKKGQIRVIKVDMDNKEVKLKDVEFKVYDEKGNVVDTLKTDKNGEATTKRLPIDQKYTIQETKTLQNYVLNDKKETVTLTQDQITDITFDNEKIKGKIEITKVSKDDNMLTKEVAGTPLENAVFEIYTEKDELVDTITTAKDGKATSKLLEYGNYYVKEKNPGSDYYLLNTEKYEIQIREHNKTIPVTIDNKSVEVGLNIDKTGLVQAQPNDEIKYSFNSLKNTSNVALDNFTWTDNLPYQYVRITKLFTGTYNEDLDYVVKYKTNKSEDYIEYGKYNTQKNNYIDFTKLELAEDEYITDYKVEFGTVMSGFEAVEKPFIFCKVLPTVKAEDRWVNYTKLTGNYKEHELEDKAEWPTISYSKKLEVKKLPRTGF